MDVNISKASSHEVSTLDESHDLFVTCRRSLRKSLEQAKYLSTVSEIPAGELSDDGRMALDISFPQVY